MIWNYKTAGTPQLNASQFLSYPLQGIISRHSVSNNELTLFRLPCLSLPIAH
jgi:hypothetical protein